VANDGGKLLVVDDDEGVSRVMEDALEQAGYDTLVAGSGREATELLEEHEITAAVVDLVLPDSTGLEVLKQVRAAHPEAVMIVITGYASLDSAMEAVKLGAYDYLRKPFSMVDLLNVLDRGLKERELAHKNRELVAKLDKTNRELLAYRDTLQSEMQVTSEKLDAFIELGKRLATSEGALPSLADVLEASRQVAGARSGAVFCLDDDGLVCVVAAGEARADLQDVRVQATEAGFEAVLISGEVMVIPDLVSAAEMESSSLSLLGFASAILVPLQYQQMTLGVIALFDSEPASFAEPSLNLLRVLAAQAGNLIVRSQLHGQATEAADQQVRDEDGFVDIMDMLK
jgi:ActR/RegA family two-component response regulator